MKPDQNTLPVDILPDLSGKEALVLAHVLMNLSDAIWRIYGADMALQLEQQEGQPHLHPTHTTPGLTDDDDFPF